MDKSEEILDSEVKEEYDKVVKWYFEHANEIDKECAGTFIAIIAPGVIEKNEDPEDLIKKLEEK